MMEDPEGSPWMETSTSCCWAPSPRVSGPAGTAPGPPLQRALLAALAIEVGRAVPVVDLIDRLWGEEPPRTATKSIQKYVSHPRRSLGAGQIVRDGHAYRPALPPEAVDARRMERELEAARAEPDPARRLARLSEALDRHPAWPRKVWPGRATSGPLRHGPERRPATGASVWPTGPCRTSFAAPCACGVEATPPLPI
jgi:hypothetical protein